MVQGREHGLPRQTCFEQLSRTLCIVQGIVRGTEYNTEYKTNIERSAPYDCTPYLVLLSSDTMIHSSIRTEYNVQRIFNYSVIR